MMSGEALPAPPVPPDVDLRDFAFTPIFRARLFGSSFHARVTDSEWRAGVTLWLKSWDQVPAGSLPDDDVDLCRLAELGRDQKTWRKVRQGALRGWFKCSDGRLYHWVVAEGVLEAWQRRRAASDKGKAGASKRWSTGNAPAMPKDARAIAGAMPGDSNRQGRDREERVRDSDARAREGVIAMGSNLTRSGDEWRTMAGIHPIAFERWLAYLNRKGVVLDPEQAGIQARELAGNGDAAAQAEVVEYCIGKNWKSLVPIGDVRSRKNGMSRTSPASSATERDSNRWPELKRRAADCGFRAPHSVETADAYETQLKIFERDRAPLHKAHA